MHSNNNISDDHIMSAVVEHRCTRNRQSFDRFSDELIQQLLSYLPFKDKFRYECVSKRFQKVIYNSTTDLRFDAKLADSMGFVLCYNWWPVLEAIVRKCPNVQRFELKDIFSSDFTDDYLYLLLKYCPKLIEISFDFRYPQNVAITETAFRRFFNLFGQQLQSFETNNYCLHFFEWLIETDLNTVTQFRKLIITGDGLTQNRCFIDLSVIFDYNWCCILPETLQSIAFQITNQSVQLFRKFADNFGQQIRDFSVRITEQFERSSIQGAISGI